MMDRVIEPEWLDVLPSDHSGAVGSRRDLRRLNAWMGNAGIMARALALALQAGTPRRLVELGAGDGHFMLKVARKLCRQWTAETLILVDQSAIVAPGTCKALAAVGGQVQRVTADAFDWLRREPEEPDTVIIANLFAHHFDHARLADLLRLVAARCSVFAAVEPRRSVLALSFSRMAGLIGCNAVTRHDAPASVRAGFAGRELSSAWPARVDWELQEGPAGFFSHLFVAKRIASSSSSPACRLSSSSSSFSSP